MLVDAGRVVWLGTEAEAAVLDDGHTVDLDGALVTPAFVDAHVHATATGFALTGLDLVSADSLAEALARVGRATQTSRGRPVIGTGWDDTEWPERRPPTAAELDRAAYGGAVYLSRVDAHSAVASSALLRAVPGLSALAGYDPSGWLRGAAHDAVRTAALALITPAQRRGAQRAALRRAAGLGIACVHEMAGPAISGAQDLADLLDLSSDPALPEVIGYWGELFGIETARELGAVGAGGDLFCDGSLGSHTAAVHEAYADRPEHHGALHHDTADLAEHVLRCIRAGLQAGFHAIGDAAVDQVLDAIDLVSARTGGPSGAGHRIEHAEYVRDPRRLATSGLVASLQPCFDATWGGSDGMYASRLGSHRAAALNRFADLAIAHVPLAFGSDAPVTELGPWAAVRAAVHPHDPSAALPAATAFAAHTQGGWRAAGRAGEGVLAPGAPATFAVWAVADVADERPGRAAGGDGTGLLPDLGLGVELPTCLATVRAGVTLHDAGILDA